MDDLRSQLRFRGLDTGYQQTPLTEFIGDLADIEVKENDKFGGTDAVFKFVNVQVIASTSPYDFAVAEISVRLQNAKGRTDSRGRYGILASSIAKFMPEDLDAAQEAGWVIGKRLHMKQTPGHMLYRKNPDGTAGETAQDAWECIGVEGAGVNGSAPSAAQNPIEVAIRLMQGKTDTEFNMAALRDGVVKANPKVVQMILTKALVPSLLSSGIVEKGADGKYEIKATDEQVKLVAESLLG